MQRKVKCMCTDVGTPPIPLPSGATELDGHTGCYWANRIAVFDQEKIVPKSFLGGEKDTEWLEHLIS